MSSLMSKWKDVSYYKHRNPSLAKAATGLPDPNHARSPSCPFQILHHFQTVSQDHIVCQCYVSPSIPVTISSPWTENPRFIP